MKKRNIIIISISTISLVFGGLVFLGISTFPELLEEEKEQIEQSPQEDVLFELPSFESNDNNAPDTVMLSSQGKSSTYVSEKGSNATYSDKHSFKNPITFTNTLEEINSYISHHEPIIERESFEVSYASHSSHYYRGTSYTVSSEEDAVEEPLLKQEQKQELLNIVQTDNSAIMNTTIMAIGVIEVLSYILVKRKRHHRFR